MKKLLHFIPFVWLLALSIPSCCEKTDPDIAKAYSYSVSVTLMESNTSAPELQSFVHGVNGSQWLLFAGRTNNQAGSDIGGIHNTDATHYEATSFLPLSYNDSVFVYDIETDQRWGVSVDTLIKALERDYCSHIPQSIFITSNPEFVQRDSMLYVLGGYGPNPYPETENYQTFDSIAMINVPRMIRLVKHVAKKEPYGSTMGIISIGTDTILKCAGGELYIINDTFYLAGGQNFFHNHPHQNNTCHNLQLYQTAASLPCRVF